MLVRLNYYVPLLKILVQFPLQDFGYIMFVAGVEHGVLHIIRFCLGGDADILYTTNVGRSGVICMLLLFPIVLPMKFKWFKDRVSDATMYNTGHIQRIMGIASSGLITRVGE